MLKKHLCLCTTKMKPSVCESKCTNVGKQLAQQILGPTCIRFLSACISALALSTAARMLALSAARREARCCSSVSSRWRARAAEEEGESLPPLVPLSPESGA